MNKIILVKFVYLENISETYFQHPPISSHRENKHLELVHIDLCGPMQTQSIGGSFYILTFIEDFSMKIRIYFLKNKSKTFSKFKQFKAEEEK
jgi:hypothetical protein